MTNESRDLNSWFETPVGRMLVGKERAAIGGLLARLSGVHLLQIGSYGDGAELPVPGATRQWVVSTAGGPGVSLKAEPYNLPVCSDSVDVVVLVHALEFSPAPHTVLRESARVLAPEGRLLIVAFNPFSFWGLRRAAAGLRQPPAPWRGHFYAARRLRDWCTLLDLEPLPGRTLFFRPPLPRAAFLRRLEWFERFGDRWLRWFGGVHVMVSRKRVARVIPMGGLRVRPLPALGRGMAWRRHARVDGPAASSSARSLAAERMRGESE